MIIRKIIKNYFAFTLAEVLITLGVIGVVAAITIPTLINNSQKSQYVAQLQKMTSVLNNGFKQIMADNNCSDIPCTGIMTSSADTTIDNVQTANVFKAIKVCHVGTAGCQDKYTYAINYSTVNNNRFYIKDYYGVMILQDGSLFGFYNPSANCGFVGGSNQYATVCAEQMVIDLNGEKGPNILGRDTFKFYLSKNGVILPIGAKDATTMGYWDVSGGYGCSGDNSGTGDTCFGRIMEQGWQMNY